MKRLLFQTMFGILLAAAGIYGMYMYMQGLNNGSNFLLLAIAVICISASIFFFYQAGKADNTIVQKPKVTELTENTSNLEATLARNNELTAQWEETHNKRDKLRMLEIANTPIKE